MELLKHVIRNETVYIPKLEINVQNNNNNNVLLGFKDSLPVISSIMENKQNNLLKNVQIETNDDGGKYIMVNGKRIKVLAESELPKNSQMVKIGNLQNMSQSPVKFKIIKGLSSKALSQIPNLTPIKLDKQITSKIGQQVSFIENKLIKIPISTVQPIKQNTSDKSGVGIDKVKTIDMDMGGGKHKQVTPNSILLNTFIHKAKVRTVQCGPLDLTKNPNMVQNSGVRRISRGSQACVNMVNKEVQTDQTGNTDDLDILLNSLDFSTLEDYGRYPATPKRIADGNFDSDLIDSSTNVYTDLNRAPSKQIENSNETRTIKEENFFKELRAALQPDDKGNLPIHIGVLLNDLKMVRRSCFILTKILKQSVDIPNNNDMSALQLAILNDASPNLVLCLLQHGSSVSVNDCDGNNVIHYAVENERTNALKLLVGFASRKDIDHFNNAGLTPLMVCCLNSYHDCAELILESEAKPNLRDQISGRTALFHAAELHDVDMVEMLLQFNACTKIKNFFGTSPHDAMYEIDEMPDAIKFMILGRNNKRKATEIIDRPSKFQKKTEKSQKVLKTYARLEKIKFPDLKTTW